MKLRTPSAVTPTSYSSDRWMSSRKSSKDYNEKGVTEQDLEAGQPKNIIE